MPDKVGHLTNAGWLNLVKKALNYPHCHPSIVWQDIEDMASIAMMNYYSRSTAERVPQTHWCVIDAIRHYLGRGEGKLNMKVNFSDLRLPEDIEAEELFPQNCYGPERIEVKEMIEDLSERYGDAITGRIMHEVVLNKSTVNDAWKDAGETSYANALRKIKRFKLDIQSHEIVRDYKIKDKTNEYSNTKECNV